MTTGSTVQVPADETQPAHRRLPVWGLVLIIVAAVVVVATGGALGLTAALTPKTFTAHGTLSLISKDGSGCDTSDGGFSDLTDGAQVKISDESGATVALGALGTGKESESGYLCTWSLAVNSVPTGERFYGVHVGNNNRGVIQYTEEKLRKGVNLQVEG